ncbi:hypothetical protein ACPXCG_12195 [Gordonia sp. DT218]|uniref:hypothetical protein n=1 Tax=Gordonia sp. DT218 TaxID=3416659 RepID=UPI003CFBBFB3
MRKVFSVSGSAWSLSSWWGVPSPWPDVAPMFTGGVPAEEIHDADTNDLVGSFVSLQRGQSFLAWQKYQTAAELHARIVGTTPDPHALFLKDSFADCAARIAMALSISQQAAGKGHQSSSRPTGSVAADRRTTPGRADLGRIGRHGHLPHRSG